MDSAGYCGGDGTRKRRGVEVADRAGGAAASTDVAPEAVASGTIRRHDSDAGNRNACPSVARHGSYNSSRHHARAATFDRGPAHRLGRRRDVRAVPRLLLLFLSRTVRRGFCRSGVAAVSWRQPRRLARAGLADAGADRRRALHRLRAPSQRRGAHEHQETRAAARVAGVGAVALHVDLQHPVHPGLRLVADRPWNRSTI